MHASVWGLCLLDSYFAGVAMWGYHGRAFKPRNNRKDHASATKSGPVWDNYWCISISPKENAEFVAHMEDILDVHRLPYNPFCPVWCMDEKLYHILGDSRESLPMRPGAEVEPEAERVSLVMDNLNTHSTASLYRHSLLRKSVGLPKNWKSTILRNMEAGWILLKQGLTLWPENVLTVGYPV